ncbi:MFS transporter [Dactylosporangium sp. AC04546]|uniref:MFS transporter n=1 Tax=Dactylosporangium sp. AC04546 TaxID=2862460 RepID=UPI001EE14643|nr:MFS transporter [Dactylosporangium sp. AC04546]WVK78761.1 MFS transporter [Dactylosporangium sp. AC04546]
MTRDRLGSGVAAFLISVSLRMAGVALPLLMVDAGQRVTTVGLLVGAAGVAQLSVRPFMAALLRRWPDRRLIGLSAILLTGSIAIVLISPTFVLLLVSQLAQGAARALFWTASQTHAVRRAERAAGGMAWVNTWSAIGQLIGPALCGAALLVSTEVALVGASVVAAAALVPTMLLEHLEPFPQRDRAAGGQRVVWLRPSVFAGCWSSATAGVVEAVSGSYLALLLVSAGNSPALAGLLISAGNIGGLAGTAVVGRIPDRWTRALLRAATVVVAAGLALTALGAAVVPLAVAGLIASGAGAGVLRTLGPAVASDAVPADERGDAITATGSFRAVSLFAAPFAIGALLTAVALPAAMVGVAVVLGLGALPGGGAPKAEAA